MKKIKALSFFSGAMGLDIGLEKAGIEVILACESEKFIRDTIKLNKPKLKVLEDINNYSAKVIYNNPLPAPINTDTEYGKLIIQNTFKGDLEYPLYAKESIKKAGIFKKISSALSFFIFGGYAE